MTHRIDLIFSEPSSDELPGPRIAQIYVKSPLSDKKENVFITSQCVSMREFEGQIELLKQELETIRKKAKQKFAKKER